MKTQAIINCVFAVAFVGYVVSQRNPTFNTITCKTWKIVDANGEERITAFTNPGGIASVVWIDQYWKTRIVMATLANGKAGVTLFDENGQERIAAATYSDARATVAWIDTNGKSRIDAGIFESGVAGVQFYDEEENQRISAATLSAKGPVLLPTKDENPPKEP